MSSRDYILCQYNFETFVHMLWNIIYSFMKNNFSRHRVEDNFINRIAQKQTRGKYNLYLVFLAQYEQEGSYGIVIAHKINDTEYLQQRTKYLQKQFEAPSKE